MVYPNQAVQQPQQIQRIFNPAAGTGNTSVPVNGPSPGSNDMFQQQRFQAPQPQVRLLDIQFLKIVAILTEFLDAGP